MSVSSPGSMCVYDEEVVKHHVVLDYNALPTYATAAFWQCIENLATPLEVLVRAFRVAASGGDDRGRNTIFSVLICRIQRYNEYWASKVLNSVSSLPDEQHALHCDLCADLCESIFRALLDTKRSFWEENFLHALRFERKHVYQAFMLREGHWHDRQVKCPSRVPHCLVMRLDQPFHVDGVSCWLEIEDEQAHAMLLAAELSDLLHLVLLLPARLKVVVLLLFWEGRSEKDIAQLLGVTDRTVRNRKREALKLLGEALNNETQCFYT